MSLRKNETDRFSDLTTLAHDWSPTFLGKRFEQDPDAVIFGTDRIFRQ